MIIALTDLGDHIASLSSVQNQSKSGNPALYNLTCNNKPFDDGLHIYTTNVKRKEGKN